MNTSEHQAWLREHGYTGGFDEASLQQLKAETEAKIAELQHRLMVIQTSIIVDNNPL